VAISPQLPAFSKELSEKHKLGFDILYDAGNKIASTYGLVYDFPADLKALYLQFGINLEETNGDGSWQLPMPARYVIGQDGRVSWASVNPDYTQRPEPEDTIAVL
jgi:peroxiredoxin